MITRLLCLTLSAALLSAGPARAQGGSFDLPGPQLHATVTRGVDTLPIGRVPQLQTGDRIRIGAETPEDRSGRHMLVVAFLRDAATPPPKNWFQHLTLTRKTNTLMVTVPQGAKHALVLLAPEVGGGLGAVVSAVRGRPGVFVRAARDLGQASLDRTRLEAFLEGVHAADSSGAGKLEIISPVLARSLAIRWSAECLQREPALRVSCLTQSREALILNDGRKATLAETLSGAPVDLAYRVSATREAGAGYYTPYITLVRDVARLLGAFQSAQYQYIPALALGRGDGLRLLLNTAPSFRKPHSVLVAPLPPVEPAELPALRPHAGVTIACASRPAPVFPIEGAPLLYAADFAHDLRLQVRTRGGNVVDVPVRPDPGLGGLVLAGTAFPSDLGPIAEATLLGRWGFEHFEGPRFQVQGARSGSWRIASGASPVVGRANELLLDGGSAACVDSVSFQQGSGVARPAEWKATGAGSLKVTLPLQSARPGPVDLWVKRHGIAPERLSLTVFNEASRVDAFVIHAGDLAGTLRGTRLDQVAGLDLEGAVFKPGGLTRVRDMDELELSTANAGIGSLHAGRERSARVRLKDGRVVIARVEVTNPRPSVAVVHKTVEAAAASGSVQMELLGEQALPKDSVLTFSLQGQAGTRFAGGELVELATLDGTIASLKAGAGLTRVDATTLVARFSPSEMLSPGAFGPLRFRVVQDGIAGNWEPLGVLVRLPVIRGVTCGSGEPTCTLLGSQLYLIQSVSRDPSFSTASIVPAGYTGSAITLPRPESEAVFLKLRDAPDVTVRVTTKL